MILLVGGTGTLGLIVARQLVAAGLPTTILSRDPERHSQRVPAAVKLVQGDLRDKGSLQKVVRGKTHVVAAAHSILGRGRDASLYVDDLGGRNLIDVSVDENIERLVYVSAWFPRHMAAIPFVAIKRRVELHLQSSGLAHSILRPTAFMDLHAEQMIGLRIAANKKVIVPGPGSARRNFVSADDVASVVVNEIRETRSVSRTIDVAGPQNLGTDEVIKIYEAVLVRPANVLHIPLAVATFGQWFFRPLHPGLSQIMAITRQTERHGACYRVEDDPQCVHRVSLRTWAQNRMGSGESC